MSTLPIAEAREHLDELCATVAETGEPVVIERDGTMFILSVNDSSKSDAITRDILSRPEDAASLRESIARARRGEGVEMSISDICNRFTVDEAGL